MKQPPAAPPLPEPRGAAVSFFKDWFLFLREAMANPRTIGAVMPSSTALARRMARGTRPAQDADLHVVELGAGTGAVTAALLQVGFPPQRVVAVERSASLAALLHARFPGVRVVCGDAAELRRLVRQEAPDATRIDVVSSLPLRSLPLETVRSIAVEIAPLVQGGGRWVQFTYALASTAVPAGFVRQASSLVWRNVPPARVDIFTAVPA